MAERREDTVEEIIGALGPLPPPRARPVLVVVSGLPGTGKSRLCQELSRRSGAVVLESDALRRRLFPRPTYSRQESRRLFDLIHAAVERLLRQGVSCILDATNLAERHRQPLYEIAAACAAELLLVEVTAPAAVALARLQQRAATPGSLSEADAAVYQRMRRQREEIGREHFVVDTSKPTEEALAAISRRLEGR